MKRLILMACVAAVACEKAPPAPPEVVDDFEARADAATKAFARELQAALQAAIKDGGPQNAIPVCNHMAPQITSSYAKDGLRLRRIGVRVRNHQTNVATEAERAAMMALTKEKPTAVITEGSRKFIRAIYAGSPVCLNCHGSEIAPEVSTKLEELYPKDEATGFALGDLRGAFVVEEM